MSTLAQKERNSKRAAAAGTSPVADRRALDQYQLMLSALWQMRRDLKDIKSIQRKIAYKRDKALPQLADYIDGVLTADTGAENDVLMYAMVWNFDVSNLTRALQLADYAIKHDLTPPDRYKRDTVTIVADETADRALDALKADTDASPADLSRLLNNIDHAIGLIDGHDIHDQVASKLNKAAGYVRRETGDLKGALENLKLSLHLNDKAGVKKDIERLEREIRKNTESHGPL